MKTTVHNLVTGEVTEVPWTAEEIALSQQVPVESVEARQARVKRELADADAKSIQVLRELVLDQAGIKPLSAPQRAAARNKLKNDDDAAEALRGQR